MSLLATLDYDAPMTHFADELAPDDQVMSSRSVNFPGDTIGDDPYSNPVNSVQPLGLTLEINQYVDWDEGGTYAPAYWMGYSTGMDPADFRSFAMTGEVAVPTNDLQIALSEKWGDVGESNYNQQLVAGTSENQTAWLPSDDTLANLALIPGFGTGF
jgi:hypothetical protein